MPNLDEQYAAAYGKLKKARNKMKPGSDEDAAMGDAMDALKVANLKRIQTEFSEGTANLERVTDELETVREGIKANQVSGALDDIDDAITTVNEFADGIKQLVDGNGDE